MLSNVSPSVGAPARVYLHSLVRRLLYSHLTPSTLSSPPSPFYLLTPAPLVLQRTTIPTPPSTSYHIAPWVTVRCDDQMHVCCLPWRVKRKIERIEFVSCWPPRGGGATTPAEEGVVEAGRARCTNAAIRSLDQRMKEYLCTHKNIHISWSAGFDWISVWCFVDRGEMAAMVDLACFCSTVELHCAGSSLFGACWTWFITMHILYF